MLRSRFTSQATCAATTSRVVSAATLLQQPRRFATASSASSSSSSSSSSSFFALCGAASIGAATYMWKSNKSVLQDNEEVALAASSSSKLIQDPIERARNDQKQAAMRGVLKRIREIKKGPHGQTNLAMKHFDEEYFNTLSEADQESLLWIVSSGYKNEDSTVGCYATQPDDYDRFYSFFSKVVADYHKVPVGKKHTTNWSLKGVEGVPEDGKLDLGKLGLPELSMRTRVGRNLADFPLPAKMTKEDRIRFEERMLKAFDVLIKNPEFGGRVYSLSPGTPNSISDQEYAQLVKSHLMFKDMSKDGFLVEAGIAKDWPYGRGCWISSDKQCIIWFGEEDHLRIMSMKKGKCLNDVFDKLKNMLDTVETIPGLQFAHSPTFGYITSCPSNCGTGCRSSVHIKCPNLTADGTDRKVKEIATPLGLSVRGTGGEHTPIGADGTIDLSPSGRFCVDEAGILAAEYKGISLIKAAEDAAGAKKKK